MNEVFFSEKHYTLRENIEEFLIKEFEPLKNEINQKKEIPLSLIKKIGKEINIQKIC